MLALKIALISIALGIILYAIFGTLFAARNRVPFGSPILKLYKWLFRGGLLLIVIAILLIIFC
ncbi:MAG: hypothetical protein IJ272_07015 [Clostridia bacterium]|nr:hypothetical protein [Clostridia bacterium]